MPDRTKTYFLSDLHLGARYLDRPHERERMVASFLKEIAADASELYLVGDILDYWYEYKTVVPRGYVRFFGALARLVDSGVKVTWIIGNHDVWLFDYLRDEIGVQVVDGTIVRDFGGSKFVIAHGDGLGELKPSFRLIRAMFRNKFCQKLYAAIHPRWTVGFAHRWSSSSRDYDALQRPEFVGRMKANVEAWARSYVSAHPDTDFIVMGHHHVMVDEKISGLTRLVILGDWIYNYSYGVFDGKSFHLRQFESANSEFNKNSPLPILDKV